MTSKPTYLKESLQLECILLEGTIVTQSKMFLKYDKRNYK